MLIMLSPLLNAGISHLKPLLLGGGIFVFAFIASLEPVCRFTGITAIGFSSQSFLSIILVYVVAGVTKRCCTKPIERKYLFMLLSIFPIVVVGVQGAASQCLRSMTTVYHYPHVYVFAIALMLLFIWYIRVPKWLGNICSFVSPSIFAVYLIHDVLPDGKLLYILPEKWLMTYTAIHPLGIIMISAILTFLLCVIMDLPRRCVCSFVRPIILPLMDTLDGWLSEKE